VARPVHGSRFAPGAIDGMAIDATVDERAVRARMAAVLRGQYQIPQLLDKNTTLQIIPRNGRWIVRGNFGSQLTFPESTTEPEAEREFFRSTNWDVDISGGREVGEPIRGATERSLLSG